MPPPPPIPPLLPYTPLFRSPGGRQSNCDSRSAESRRDRRPRRGAFGSSRPPVPAVPIVPPRSEEHTSELQSRLHLVCRLLLEKKKQNRDNVRVCEAQGPRAL